MKFDQFIGGAYTLNSINAQAQRCVNWYVEMDETGTGKNAGVLIPTPGLQSFGSLANVCRGLFSGSGRLFAVQGTSVSELNSSGSVIASRSGLVSSSDPVTVAANGNDLIITSGGRACRDDGTTITQLNYNGGSTPLLLDTVCFVDGFYVGNVPNSNQFQISNAFNGAVWDAADFAKKEGYSDYISRCYAFNGDLWLMGRETMEVWRANGSTNDFPFSRNDSGTLPLGLVARYSVSDVNGVLFWVGASQDGGPVAYMAVGYSPQRISTHAIEEAWRAMSSGGITTARGFCYSEGGHTFYVVTVPGIGTWVYDLISKTWHERGVWSGSAFNPARYLFHAYVAEWGVAGVHIVSDASTTALYRMGLAYYDEAGNVIRRRRTSPYLVNELNRIQYSELTVDLDVGSSIGGTPSVLLSWSEDNGRTFTTPISPTTAIQSSNTARCVFRKLGMGRQRIWNLDIEGATRTAVANVYLEATPTSA